MNIDILYRLLVTVLVTARWAAAESKQFNVIHGKELRRCSHNNNILENIPHVLLCSQMCIAEGWRCQSFNFYSQSHTCELLGCSSSSDASSFELSDNSECTHYDVMSTSYYECETIHGTPVDTCNPTRTVSCTPGGVDSDGRVTPRVCNCHSSSTGDDCNEGWSGCTADSVCFEYQKSPSTLDSAQVQCAVLGGNVFTVDTAAGNTRLSGFLSYITNGDILIGLEYYANYEDFAYSGNMQPLTGYSNWLEVKNSTDRLGCVKLSSVDDYKWVDVDCATELPYICEVPNCGSGLASFNGSCYYFDPHSFSWDTQNDQCYNRRSHSRLAVAKYREENDYLIASFNNNFGTSEPVVLGINDWIDFQTFRFAHNEWIALDWNESWNHLGCYSNSPSQIGSLEGTYAMLQDDKDVRSDPIKKCYYASRELGYKVFGIEDGGTCRSSVDAHLVYANLGETTGCSGGEGAVGKIDIYQIPNHNLFYDFAFETDPDWNTQERIFHWWAADSWRWHDANCGGRAVCKVEYCPQGFVSHANKCFKVINKLQTREVARDECQRYNGADLWNPEYPDEAESLTDIISEIVLETMYFWSGVVDVLGNGTNFYEVMKKSVGDNYNVYTLGADPIFRLGQDNTGQVTHVEMRWRIPSNGKIAGWEYYSGQAGHPVLFSVLRPEPGACNFYVVGINSYTAGIGYNRVDVPENERISVQAGDYVAMTFTGASSIRYNNVVADANICHTHSVAVQTSGSSINMGGRTTSPRIYSYRGLFKPESTKNETPFDSDSPSAETCFMADYERNLLLRKSSCTGTAYSICEIKKYNRVSP